MSNYDAGKSYEDFVETVYKAILEAERRNGNIGHVTLERRKKITSKSGTPAEIDIYWEYTVAGIKNSVAIECRNYNKNVDIPGVRDFARKISDISGLKGLMVTKKGYSQNAIAEASADNIDLLVMREHEAADWDGYIKTIAINIHVLEPCRTMSFETRVNKEWAADNGYEQGQKTSSSQNNLIIIEDKKTGFKHTLLDLEQNDFFENKGVGEHFWEKDFEDGWVQFGSELIKVDKVKIGYLKPPTSTQGFSIDFEDYVLAVMEYINGQTGKFVVMTSGERKEY